MSQVHLKTGKEHITDLKFLSYKIGGFVFWGIFVAHLFNKDISAFLLHPINSDTSALQFLSPIDPFLFILKIDFIFGIFFVLPFIMLLIWRYVHPATNYWGKIQQFLSIWVLTLISWGAAFYTYKILIPIVLDFMAGIAPDNTSIALDSRSYLNFVLLTSVLMIFIFYLPFIIRLLTIIGIIQPEQLKEKRFHIYCVLLIAIAIITPTTDMISFILVSLPAIVSTEIGLLLSSRAVKKYSK